MTVTDFDPPASGSPLSDFASPLDELSDAADRATDAYAQACDEAAVAENDAERAYYVAFAKFEGSVASREHEAKNASLDERARARHKGALEKATRARVTTLLARLSAAQSHARNVRDQT